VGRKELSAQEATLAQEELEVAAELIAGGRHRIALTRIYFAAFHAARALLYHEGFAPKTHRGTITLFNQQMVRTRRFEPAISLLLSSLQRFREDADYGDTLTIDEPTARQQLDAARGFVVRAREQLET
jgi:uncharacterized protein (UPF0332 family)